MKLKKIMKTVTNPAGNIATLVGQTGSALSKGNVVRAVALTSNPLAIAGTVAGVKGKQLDYLRATSPTSVMAIQNKSIRKKAVIGYGVAGAIAGGIALAPAGSIAGGMGSAKAALITKASEMKGKAGSMLFNKAKDLASNPVINTKKNNAEPVAMKQSEYEKENPSGLLPPPYRWFRNIGE